MTPIRKICDYCVRPFYASTPNQTTCMQCLIKPRPDKPPEPKEPEEMAQPNCPKEKTCIDCEQVYTPTSNVQKRCPECGEKKKQEQKNEWKKRAKPKPKKSAKSEPHLKEIGHVVEAKPRDIPAPGSLYTRARDVIETTGSAYLSMVIRDLRITIEQLPAGDVR